MLCAVEIPHGQHLVSRLSNPHTPFRKRLDRLLDNFHIHRHLFTVRRTRDLSYLPPNSSTNSILWMIFLLPSFTEMTQKSSPWNVAVNFSWVSFSITEIMYPHSSTVFGAHFPIDSYTRTTLSFLVKPHLMSALFKIPSLDGFTLFNAANFGFRERS